MPEITPNVHDPDIREMVLSSHRPREMWSVGGDLITVICDVCGREWPCTSIETARYVERLQRDTE